LRLAPPQIGLAQGDRYGSRQAASVCHAVTGQEDLDPVASLLSCQRQGPNGLH
jgi:hypothetical protein